MTKMSMILIIEMLLMRAIYRKMKSMKEIFAKITMWLLTFKSIVLIKSNNPLMTKTT